VRKALISSHRSIHRPASGVRDGVVVVYWEAMRNGPSREELSSELPSSMESGVWAPSRRYRLLLLSVAALIAVLAHSLLAPLLRTGFSQAPAWRLRLAVSLPALFLMAIAVGSGVRSRGSGSNGASMERKVDRGEEIRDQ
jgi:hypothetical protein